MDDVGVDWEILWNQTALMVWFSRAVHKLLITGTVEKADNLVHSDLGTFQVDEVKQRNKGV